MGVILKAIKTKQKLIPTELDPQEYLNKLENKEDVKPPFRVVSFKVDEFGNITERKCHSKQEILNKDKQKLSKKRKSIQSLFRNLESISDSQGKKDFKLNIKK